MKDIKMTLYIGGKPYNNSNDLSDLLNAVEKLPFHGCFYSRPLYINCNTFYIIHKNNDIYYSINCNKHEKAKLRSDILLIVKSQEKSIIRVNKQTTEDSILNFLPKESMNKIEVAIVGGSYIESQFYSDMDENVLKVLDVLANYQHGDIVINNYIANRRRKIKVDPELHLTSSEEKEEYHLNEDLTILNNKGCTIINDESETISSDDSAADLGYNTDEEHNDVQVNNLIQQQGQTDNRKTTDKTPSKKPFIYGSSTTLIFLAVAATLHFSSSNSIAHIAALAFMVASIFAGLIVGLVTHYCMMPNQKLEDMKFSESIKKGQVIENQKQS